MTQTEFNQLIQADMMRLIGKAVDAYELEQSRIVSRPATAQEIADTMREEYDVGFDSVE